MNHETHFSSFWLIFNLQLDMFLSVALFGHLICYPEKSLLFQYLLTRFLVIATQSLVFKQIAILEE